jgi:hypothetical protein
MLWPQKVPKKSESIVTDLINPLPGNSSVNTVQHASIEEAMFSIDPTDASIDWLDSDHVMSVYCRSMSVSRLYNESRELWVQSELELGVQKSTRSLPVRIYPAIWRLYMCNSTVIREVCDLVRLLQFPCYKSVARKRIVKTVDLED